MIQPVWEKLSLSFDRITAAAVVQYLTTEKIDSFICNASGYLNEEGKIVFFDIIDPRFYSLWKPGCFSQNFRFWNILPKVGLGCFKKISATLKNRPEDIIGNAHRPYMIEKIASKHGFNMEYVKSTYYEYRYHAIFSKVP
jgi:cyclopropane fatty-acyl-phospholipid synthase-like methyltransferase